MKPKNYSQKLGIRGIFFCLLLCIAVGARACLWDYDTLAMEAKGLPDVVQIISGRFERNPPLYYEMRLARVTKEMHTHPENLALYDDAGVACDRLGRDDEALQWMAKKRTRLDKLPQNAPNANDHRYRYYANIGTFRVHRWLKQGVDRKRIKEVEQARAEIVKAIKINPNAHFGREKVQLAVMDWMLQPILYDDDVTNDLGNYIQYGDVERDKASVKGLLGLFALGNAWESVDIFAALGSLLEEQRQGTVGYLAKLRASELVDQGKGSLKYSQQGEALKQRLGLKSSMSHTEETVRDGFPKLRQAADTWQAHRTEYMMERLKAGDHPDTNPNFWNGYREVPPLELKDSLSTQIRVFSKSPTGMLYTGLTFLFAVPVTLGFVVRKIWRIYQKRRKVASEQGLL